MAVMQESEHHRTAWTGWVSFASVMMIVVGAFHVIEGLVALFKDDYFLVGSGGLVLEVDYTAWGVAHLGLGLLLVFAAVSLLSGHLFGMATGVVVATISTIVNIGFLAAYPVWSVIMIAIDIIVIYAIVVHGRELESEF